MATISENNEQIISKLKNIGYSFATACDGQIERGFENGYGEGYPEGYKKGYPEGYKNGYAAGYSYGWRAGGFG